MTAMIFSFASMAATVIASLLLLRAYLVWLQIPYTDPLMRMARRWTDWLTQPIAGFVSRSVRCDTPSLAGVAVLALAIQILGWLSGGLHVAPWWVLVGALAQALRWALELAMWALIIYGILSWFARGARMWPAYSYLITPMITPWQKIFPRVKGFDTAPLGLFIILYTLVMILMPWSTKCL